MKKLLYLLLFIGVAACDKPLEEEVFSSFGPNNFFKTADDAEALLNAAYALEQKQGTDGFRNIFVMAEVTTDLLIIREGGLRGLAQPLEDFTWNASHEFFDVAWTRYYSAIYRANLVIDNVPNIDFDEERKKQIVAEARFLRASGYIYLYDLFGPTPIITNSVSTSEDRPARASKEEFIKFVTDELTAASEVLPVAAKQYGRATKGAALAFLTKFYLNNKDWAKANETAQKVIALNAYSLFDAPNRTDLFKLANEKNSEFIYVRPHVAQPGLGTNYLPHAAPPNYKYKGVAKANYATQLKTLSSFYDSFDPKDQRLGAFLTEYDDLSGKHIVLGQDDKRSFKFEEDLPATGADMGNDFPVVRYADILLSKAEAINELSGPTQEAIALVNQVRAKAGLPALAAASYATKDAFRAHILKERGWEFFSEELRRQDLIRHGKFIELAKARGKVAFDYQVLFPLPQSEIDRNPSLKQNEGYK
ncbi:RagB/SusD family nutrient uptake outer membrane protein [Dyadobacter sp. CY326]|uniref:RagB/SusD family nutrient uptake outer membrane protein n=1 Tax=Dyadobacter sp. CY326 TaxID=2907300 RepID=UPI001F20ACAE|nr:RagB/SusD family nutrient uptake outer membrane protein [Dyadobacter sp. CY326]MCE7066642.1 RagB/SusD family nutrient uptake outer membrane protein [Dyadobacter sp. CY326]